MSDAGSLSSGAPRPLTRRRMLGLATMAAGLATASVAGCDTGGGAATGVGGSPVSRVSAPPPVGVLGANVNQDLDATNFAELENVSATWLRGFYPMQNADQGNVANQPGMRKLGTAVDHGYGTVLNLKFKYDQGLPAAGSGAMNLALARLDKVLAVVMGKVDILVLGNEPFFECGKQDRATPAINEFYEALAQHTIEYRHKHLGSSAKTQIYMGALTTLEHPQNSEVAQIARWLDFVKNNPSIAGTDCHPHVASLADGQKYLDYVLPRMRPDQKFLATEFSLVKLWKDHLKDPIPTEFADRYRMPRGTLVWQAVQDSIEHLFPQRKWNEFLLSSSWFADNQGCMSDMVAAFRNTGRCAVAAYGITQDAGAVKGFGPNKTPWVFNSIFCPLTVQKGADGLPGHNVTWIDEFRALQHT